MLRILLATICVLHVGMSAFVAKAEVAQSCQQYSADIDAALAKDAYVYATETLAKMDIFCTIAKQLKSVDGTSEVKTATQKIFAWADAHKNGDAFGKLALALMMNFSDDYTTILALERGTALNDVYSALRLGDKYYNGDMPFKIEENHNIAALLYKKATANGQNSEAMGRLANMYLSGDGVLQDYSEAMRLLALAVAKGDSNSMILLGAVWHEGRGVEPDNYKAYIWFSLASENIRRKNPKFADDAIYAEAQRDAAAAALDKKTLLRAQSLAKQCLASGYKDCGY